MEIQSLQSVSTRNAKSLELYAKMDQMVHSVDFSIKIVQKSNGTKSKYLPNKIC